MQISSPLKLIDSETPKPIRMNIKEQSKSNRSMWNTAKHPQLQISMKAGKAQGSKACNATELENRNPLSHTAHPSQWADRFRQGLDAVLYN